MIKVNVVKLVNDDYQYKITTTDNGKNLVTLVDYSGMCHTDTEYIILDGECYLYGAHFLLVSIIYSNIQDDVENLFEGFTSATESLFDAGLTTEGFE